MCSPSSSTATNPPASLPSKHLEKMDFSSPRTPGDAPRWRRYNVELATIPFLLHRLRTIALMFLPPLSCSVPAASLHLPLSWDTSYCHRRCHQATRIPMPLASSSSLFNRVWTRGRIRRIVLVSALFPLGWVQPTCPNPTNGDEPSS